MRSSLVVGFGLLLLPTTDPMGYEVTSSRMNVDVRDFEIGRALKKLCFRHVEYVVHFTFETRFWLYSSSI